jgi:hypothetical protein
MGSPGRVCSGVLVRCGGGAMNANGVMNAILYSDMLDLDQLKEVLVSFA